MGIIGQILGIMMTTIGRILEIMMTTIGQILEIMIGTIGWILGVTIIGKFYSNDRRIYKVKLRIFIYLKYKIYKIKYYI